MENKLKCESCGVKLHRRGKQKRRVLSERGQSLELERDYLVCPKCGVGLFPLDEKGSAQSGPPQAQASDQSYTFYLGGLQEFGQRLWLEASRREWELALANEVVGRVRQLPWSGIVGRQDYLRPSADALLGCSKAGLSLSAGRI